MAREGAFTPFGFETPEQVRQRIGRTRELEEEALVRGFGKGSPAEFYGRAAFRAGRGIAKSMQPEEEHPDVIRARTLQRIMPSVDVSTSKGLYAGAKALMDAGLIGDAGVLTNKAAEMRKIELEERPAQGKAPKTRTIREGKDLVNQEWDSVNRQWVEVGRGPVSKQTIQLSRTPSEQAAGKEFTKILESATTAENSLFTVQKARTLLPNIETGKLEPLKTWATSWADAIGVPIDVDKMSDAVTFRSVMKGAVLDGMASIKGTASEADRQTVEDSVAALESPELANKFLLDTAESLAMRNIEKADFWDTWARNNEGSLLGVRRAWSKRISKIPLIKSVRNKPFHYYQYKEKAKQANSAIFQAKGWTEQQINDAIDQMWLKEK